MMSMESQGGRRIKGYGLALLAATCFAFIAIFGKLLMAKGFSAAQMLAIQLPLATLFALPAFLGARHPKAKGAWHSKGWYLALQGMVGSAGTLYFNYKALEQLPASMATMFLFLYPVLVVVIFALGGIKRMAWYNYLTVVVVVFGAGLALNLTDQAKGLATIPWQGIVYGLLSALCYAIYHVIGETKLRDIPSMIATFYTLAFASLAAVALLPLTGGMAALYVFPVGAIDLSVLGMFVAVALIANLLPIYLIYRAIALIGADQVAIVSTLELPITLALALLILKEVLFPVQCLGIVMIIAAIYMLHTLEAKAWKT